MSLSINLKDPILQSLIQNGKIEKTIGEADFNGDEAVSMDEYVEYQTLIDPNSSENTYASKFDFYVEEIDKANTKFADLAQNCGYLFKNCPGVLRLQIPTNLNNWNPYVRSNAVEQIQYAPEAERSGLIKLALGNNDAEVRYSAVHHIECTPEAERAGLIRLALGNNDVEVRRSVVHQILYAPEAERVGLIKLALGNSDVVVRRCAVDRIEFAPEAERVGLIKLALDDNDLEVRRRAVDQIQYVAENEKPMLRLLTAFVRK